MSLLYADIAVPLAVDKLFTYIVPTELQPAASPGVRVVVPFGKRTAVGIIIELKNQSSVTRLKSITDVIDDTPVVAVDLLHLAEWIAEYYVAPLGEVLKTMLVRGALQPGIRVATIASGDAEQSQAGNRVTRKEQEVLDLLENVRTMKVSQIQRKLGIKSIHAMLNSLEARGFISVKDLPPSTSGRVKVERVVEISEQAKAIWAEWLERFGREKSSLRLRSQIAAVQALTTEHNGAVTISEFLKNHGVKLSTVRTLSRKNVLTIGQREVVRAQEYDLYPSSLGATDITLTPPQIAALTQIISGTDGGQFRTYLLHGVTGSGKTQVYIEAIRSVLANGKAAIVLVPEIALTPQIVRRFKHHFGDKVVVQHSRMSEGERQDAWRMAREGRCSVVIGPRSAVFAPLANLGIIIVDEEQESTYKQFDKTPRYHARDVAIMRARGAGAVVVLGSATPSLESYNNARSGKYALLELPNRIDGARLPNIEIVDMAEERRSEFSAFRAERKAEFESDPVKARASTRKLSFDSISRPLAEKIAGRLGKKEGIILLQNRRGFAPFVECPDCGCVEMCDNCHITLTYHRTKNHLRCHYCGLVKRPPSTCPSCHGANIQMRGFGTQRVEDDIKKLFPSATVSRMDLDTTTRKGSHDAILKGFAEGDVDILLGTQMVAKGLDFSRVTLVGVISADTQMLLPDFRSAERTFQLLTQVAGRSGRSTLAGEVVIQTFQSSHYSLKHVARHDFQSFYNEELQFRNELNYPPFSRLAMAEFKARNETEASRHSLEFGKMLTRFGPGLLILGPAPAAIPRLKGLYRYHIIIKDLKSKDPSGKEIHRALGLAMHSYKSSDLGRSASVQCIVDVDPVGAM